MNIFNDFGVLSHKPTKDLINKFHVEIYTHIEKLLKDGMPLVESVALGHLFSNAMGGVISEVTLREQLTIAAARRCVDNYQI